MNPTSSARRPLGLLLVFAALLFTSSTAATPAGHSFAVDPGFDESFDAILDDAGVPGGAWAIIADGKVERSGAHGVRALDDPRAVVPGTVFRIASLSKTFAAGLAAILVDDGKLRWDQPITTFAPRFRLRNEAQRGLELQHIVGQSSGLVPNAFDNLVDAGQSLERILPNFRTLAPGCAPGRCYGYQNILFAYSAQALEKAGGKDYATQIRERIFTPLAMHTASFGRDALLASPDHALPHVRRNDAWRRVEVEENYYQLPAAAGINASVLDLAQWVLAQMGRYPQVVDTTQVATLTRPRVATPKDMGFRFWKDVLSSAHYGLGWRIYRIGDEPIVLHSGWVKGYVGAISYSPRLQRGLVVLLNGETRRLNEIVSGFWVRQFHASPHSNTADITIRPASAGHR
jgi:beta-lactamase class C